MSSVPAYDAGYGPPGGAGWDPGPSSISVTDAISRAWDHTKRILFPFDLGKWLTLGFVAFLATLGEGGRSSFNFPDLGGRGGGGPDPVFEWIRSNLELVLIILGAAFVIGFAIGIALLWVSSRAKLMFVDCVVNDRAAVKEPWERFRELGKRLFWFRFWLSMIGLAVVTIAIGVGALIAWPDIAAFRFGTPAMTGSIVGFALLLVPTLALWVIAEVVEDFVVPTMVLHMESVRPAWERVKAGLFRGRTGEIVVFYLMKIVLSIAIGLIAFVLTCITCCIVAIPYIGTVMLLPLFVFSRSYSILFIQQFGPEWQLVRTPEPPPY